MNHINETIALHNGYQIPIIGLGTWKSPEDRTTVNAICAAVNAGYRHVDTAAYYQNEVSVGEGIRACGITRSKLFVTSKVWNSDRGYGNY